jgi:phosphatidylinositol-3-phosphatase
VRRGLTLLLILLAVTTCSSARAVEGAPSLDHVVVIVFENKEEQEVIGSPQAPTFTSLAHEYVRFTRYQAVTHPSLPNYIALVSGGTQGIRSDCTSCVVDVRNLADTLGAAGRTWKTYAEGLPRPGFTGARYGRYVKKHVPFLYFRDVVRSPARRQRVVPLTQLRQDIDAGALSSFALVVPDLCHSMHDCSVRTGDRWLAAVVPPLLRLENTLVFVTFDEGHPGRGRNHIAALALGTAVRPATRVTAVTGHYSFLRTAEAAWGLPLLGHSAGAKPFTGIWRQS